MPSQKTLPDIPTPVVTGAQAPDTSTAQLIQQVGEVAGQTVKDVQKNRLEQEVQQSADVVTAVSAAAAEKGAGAFTPEGELNTEGLSPDLQQQIARVQATAGAKLKRIASAVQQGATSQNAAALETEATVRELISQTPGFASEIKQLARELVGFDPTGFALQRILDIDAPKSTRLTAQQKRLEEAQTLQDGLARAGRNVPIDTILGNLAIRDQSKLEQEIQDSQLEIGTHTIRQWAQKSFVEKGVDLNGVMLKIVQFGQEGGVSDPTQYTNAVIQQREADKQAFRAQVAAKGGMDTGEMQAIEKQIDSMYEPLISTMKDNKKADFIANRLDLIAKANQMWAKQATPRLTKILDAYGDRVGGQLLEMMSNVADPAQFELIYSFDPALKALITSGAVTQQDASNGVERVIGDTISGAGISQGDQQYRSLAETQLTQPGNQAAREAYVKGLGQSGAPIRAVSILSTKVPRVQATEDEVKFAKDQFDTYIGTQATESIPGNLIDSVAREIMELAPSGVGGQLQIAGVTETTLQRQLMGLEPKATGQNKLIIPFDPSRQGAYLDFQTTSMKRLQPFLDLVTTKGYAADLGVDKATFPQTIIARINDRIETLRTETAPAKAEKPSGEEESMFTSIFNPSMVTGWALPENRPAKLEEISPDQYIEAVMLAESNGDQNAVSRNGALGSMQVMPATADNPGFGIRPANKNPDGTYDLNDLDRVGQEYIQKMLERYDGDFEAALVAYNAGPGNADKWLAAGKDYNVLPDTEQTEPYVRRAFDHLKEITKKGGKEE